MRSATNGQPLGSHANSQGRIDLIAQSWSVLSHAAPAALAEQAMAAVETHLVDLDAGLVKLLDPPLTDALPSAGYIQAYPPGVREMRATPETAQQAATQWGATLLEPGQSVLWQDLPEQSCFVLAV